MEILIGLLFISSSFAMFDGSYRGDMIEFCVGFFMPMRIIIFISGYNVG